VRRVRGLAQRLRAKDARFSRAIALAVVALLVWAWRHAMPSELEGSGRRREGSRRSLSSIPDPTFGDARGLVYKRDALSGAWEIFLDALSFERTSPIREHLRQLFQRQEMDEQLLELFDILSDGETRLTREQVARLSQGIGGEVHVLLNSQARIPLAAATEDDLRFLAERFDEYFPAERPLMRSDFPGVVKLLLLRRVVRTLMDSVGLERLQEGLSAPFVVTVTVDLGGERPPFRIHTVAPKSMPGVASGERISSIQEDVSDPEGEEVSGEELA